MSSPWPLVVPRSSQLDAARLDTELSALLSEQLRAALALLPTVSAGTFLRGMQLLSCPSHSVCHVPQENAGCAPTVQQRIYSLLWFHRLFFICVRTQGMASRMEPELAAILRLVVGAGVKRHA